MAEMKLNFHNGEPWVLDRICDEIENHVQVKAKANINDGDTNGTLVLTAEKEERLGVAWRYLQAHPIYCSHFTT